VSCSSLDAYEAVGGGVLCDLFEEDDGGWLQDVALLDGLVAAKLKAEAETVAVDFPYGHTRGLRALEGTGTQNAYL
jgi:ParB family chromosome partitioning protein